MRNKFPDPLLLEALPNGKEYILHENFRFIRSEHDIIEVPKGEITDFASIPRFFWRILPPFGEYSKAAVVHDYFCRHKLRTYKEAASIFLEAMEELGVNKWKRNIMYRAVLCCGPKW